MPYISAGLKIQRSLILFLSFFYFTFILFYFSFPLFLKMDNRTVHKEKRWTKRRVLVLTKEIDAINITTMIFFLFIYLFLTFTDDYFSSALFSARFSTSLYSSPIFFLLRAVPYIYNISYKRSLACTYFQNQSNKRVFFFFIFL